MAKKKCNYKKVVPLRLVGKDISIDTLATIQRLEDLTQSGDCLGIAFGAILRGGQIAHGFTGEAIEHPYTAIGILNQVISDLLRYVEEGHHEV